MSSRSSGLVKSTVGARRKRSSPRNRRATSLLAGTTVVSPDSAGAGGGLSGAGAGAAAAGTSGAGLCGGVVSGPAGASVGGPADDAAASAGGICTGEPSTGGASTDCTGVVVRAGVTSTSGGGVNPRSGGGCDGGEGGARGGRGRSGGGGGVERDAAAVDLQHALLWRRRAVVVDDSALVEAHRAHEAVLHDPGGCHVAHQHSDPGESLALRPGHPGLGREDLRR